MLVNIKDLIETIDHIVGGPGWAIDWSQWLEGENDIDMGNIPRYHLEDCKTLREAYRRRYEE